MNERIKIFRKLKNMEDEPKNQNKIKAAVKIRRSTIVSTHFDEIDFADENHFDVNLSYISFLYKVSESQLKQILIIQL